MTLKGRLPSGILARIGFAIVCLAPAGSMAESECTCRYAGQSYAIGTCVCISRPGAGRQYACCGMVLNNTSWQFSEGDCPVAMSVPVEPARAATVVEDGFASAAASAVPRPRRP